MKGDPDDMELCGRPMCRHARHLHSRGERACRLASCTCTQFIESHHDGTHAVTVDAETALRVAQAHNKENPQ